MDFGWKDLIPGYAAYDFLWGDPARQQKKGYDQATQLGNESTQKLVDFYTQQQKQAEGYYKPLQGMFQSAYGSKGLQAPVTANPMGSMFGGAK